MLQAGQAPIRSRWRHPHLACRSPPLSKSPNPPKPKLTMQWRRKKRCPEGGFYLHVFWKDGLNYRAKQGLALGTDEYRLFDRQARLSGRFGARLQIDAAGYVTSRRLGDIPGDIDVRRFFIYTTGEFELWFPILFKVELGTKDNRFFADNGYFSIADLPWIGTFKFGVFGAPMSLADRSNGDFRPFMEVASPVAAFAPGTKAGFQVADYTAAERFTWTLGWFADAQNEDVGDRTRSHSRLVGRVTWLPACSSSSKSAEIVSSPIALASKSSSNSSSPEAAHREDVRDYTAAHLQSGGTVDELRQQIASLAAKRGITDWENNEPTFRAIGAGLAKAGYRQVQVDAFKYYVAFKLLERHREARRRAKEAFQGGKQ
jgi:hypothetical protein